MKKKYRWNVKTFISNIISLLGLLLFAVVYGYMLYVCWLWGC